MADKKPNKHPEMDTLAIISSSRYSPVALRHLPQPIPNDLPPVLDGSIFTFEDAFEDLLAVSQGRQLQNIHHKYEQRQLLRRMFPTGEPSWFWMRRLESQNLIKVPPFSSLFQNIQQDWDRLHEGLDHKTVETSRRMSKGNNSATDQSADMFEELGRAFRHVEREFTGNRTVNKKESSIQNGEEGNGPEHFDELFSALSSSWPETTASWDTFRKGLQEIGLEHPNNVLQPQVDRQSDYKTETSTDEYLDRFGYLHRSVTRIKRDNDGKEIGREKQITIRPAEPEEVKGKVQINSDTGCKPEDISKRSWFWK